MKVVLQLVKEASVSVDGKLVSSIGKGFLLLVGFGYGDDEPTCEKMAKKISKLRVFPDANGKTNLSLFDVGGEVLAISQFTLLANLREGNRPSFVSAMRGEQSKPLYEHFLSLLALNGVKAKAGIFGADMKVSLINDGPFTLVLDSKELWG